MRARTGIITASTQPATYVLATGTEGSRAALATAIPLARGAGGRLVVVIPHIVPRPIPVEQPVDSPALVANRLREAVDELGGDADIRVCLCRQVEDVVLQLLPAGSTVVIGGRAGRWWHSKEERLARRLSRRGYHAVFAPRTGSDSTTRPLPRPASHLALLAVGRSIPGVSHLAHAKMRGCALSEAGRVDRGSL